MQQAAFNLYIFRERLRQALSSQINEDILSKKPAFASKTKKAFFSSCKTDFSRRSYLINENYDILTM